jgi:hypothetical protein
VSAYRSVQVPTHERLSVPLIDILNGSLTVGLAWQINVYIGPLATFQRQKPLKEQIESDGIDDGDFERITDNTVGSRPTTLYEDGFRPPLPVHAPRSCNLKHRISLAVPKPGLDSFAAITDDPTPEVAATSHQRTVITIQEQYLSEWLSPNALSKERLEHILSDKEVPYFVHHLAA